MKRLLLVSVVALGLTLPVVPVLAQTQNVVVEVCESTIAQVPEAGSRLCKSIDSGQVIVGDVCTSVGLPPEVCSSAVMQPVEDPELLNAHEVSWLARAHALQRALDDRQPLLNTLIVHTHNSNNATAYEATVTGADPNQIYSVTDQLRLESRGIELDLHWAPSLHGTLETGGRAVVLCHGQSQTVGGLTIHVGCSNDRPFESALVELRAWVTAHPDEFLLLYLENQLEDDPLAHDLAAAAIEEYLGPFVHRPATECAEPDYQLTQEQLVQAGTPILIVGNCGAGGDWGSWVHVRGDRWQEGGNGAGYPPWPDCVDLRDDEAYDANFTRTWEDSTWLSAMVGGGSTITPDEASAMVDCGLDLIGLDRIVPFDERLEAMIWSWDVDQPTATQGMCAQRQASGRFRSEDCQQQRHFACHGGAGWFMPDDEGNWFDGFDVCEQAGGRYATPPTGFQNRLLGAAGADAGAVWLNYQSLDGGWVVGLNAPPTVALASRGPTTPTTGGGVALVAAMLLLPLAARAARRPV